MSLHKIPDLKKMTITVSDILYIMKVGIFAFNKDKNRNTMYMLSIAVSKFLKAVFHFCTWPEITDIINILLYPQFAYHFEHGLICNTELYYAMIKITKCENCVVCFQFTLITRSRLKPRVKYLKLHSLG